MEYEAYLRAYGAALQGQEMEIAVMERSRLLATLRGIDDGMRARASTYVDGSKPHTPMSSGDLKDYIDAAGEIAPPLPAPIDEIRSTTPSL